MEVLEGLVIKLLKMILPSSSQEVMMGLLTTVSSRVRLVLRSAFIAKTWFISSERSVFWVILLLVMFSTLETELMAAISVERSLTLS